MPKGDLRVAAIGDNCMDVYPRIGRQYPTGNAVDFAVNVCKLGIPTAIISVTGNDDYGNLMRDTLEREGLDITHLRKGDAPTAVTTMDMDGKDRVHGEYVEGVLAGMQFAPEEIAFAAGHDLVHTAFWGKADAYLAQLRVCGALISFDYATKWQDALVERTLPNVDYAFFSLPKDQAADFLKGVCARGVKAAVATFGSAGSMAYDGQSFEEFGIYPAVVENTVGAGDAFIAGFMVSILKGGSNADALRAGAQVAAKVVEVFEPWAKT